MSPENSNVAPALTFPADQGVLNWASALRQCELDDATLRDLAAVFLAECPKLLAEIQEAMTAGDAPKLRRAAHTIKGSAALFEGLAATTAARTLEECAKEKNFAAASAALPPLESALAQFTAALARHVQPT